MIYFLTSSPSLYMDGALNPANQFIDNLRRALPGRIHGVFIPTHPDDVGFSEHCSDCMRAAFEEAGIHFESYTLLDRRNAPFAESIIGGSNFVILGGGHVPTQNAFLHDIHLPQLIKYFGGVVLGISHEMNVPVKYIGLGEKMTDLQPFNRKDFVESLFEGQTL